DQQSTALCVFFCANSTDPNVVSVVSDFFSPSGQTFWLQVGAMTNAQSGGNGYLAVYQLPYQKDFKYPNSITVNCSPHIANGSFYYLGVIAFNNARGVRNVQFKTGGPLVATSGALGSFVSIPTVPHQPKQNGMMYMFGTFARPPASGNVDGAQWGYAN